MNNFIDKFNAYPLGQKVLFLIVLMVMIAVGFYFALYEPMQNQIKSQESKLITLQREKEKLEQLKANKAEVEARLAELNTQLFLAREKLPTTAEVPGLLQRIHNQAKTAGLEIQKFKRVPNATKDYYIEIPVETELTGTYDELANFFYYVGRMTRIVNVQNIDLQKTSKGRLDPDGQLRVKALATTFMYRKDAGKTTTKKKKKKKRRKKK